MTLTLPIYWVNEKKTKASTTHLVGMNWYRNAHHHAQNQMKKDFNELVVNQLNKSDAKNLTSFKITYKLYYKNPSCDGSNIIALIEKFVLDALQAYEVLENDNVKHHLGSSWEIIGQDKDNPRCEITLIDLNNEE